MSTATPAAASAAPAATPATTTGGGAPAAPAAEIVPAGTTLLQAARLAIREDKAIQMDYYVDTANARAFIGEDGDTKEKVLVKSKEEFTSLIQKLYKVGDDLLIVTENSIYIIAGKVQKRRVNLAALQGESDD
jgi:hypothetical protein